MRIAIVGKGGSGKSSVAWLVATHLAHTNKKVLAIDADFNMDLAHNLGVDPDSVRLLKTGEKDIYDRFGLSLDQNAFDILDTHTKEIFSFSPDDLFVHTFARKISDNMHLMVLGDHDEHTMYSGRCSHAYAKAIKFFLPYLSLQKDEVVVADSVAGTDMINYGLYLGVDVIVCVVEDTKNSVAVYESVRRLAEKLGIPVIAVGNKKTDKPQLFTIPHHLVCSFVFDEAMATYSYDVVRAENKEAVAVLWEYITKHIIPRSTIPRMQAWRVEHDAYESVVA